MQKEMQALRTDDVTLYPSGSGKEAVDSEGFVIIVFSALFTKEWKKENKQLRRTHYKNSDEASNNASFGPVTSCKVN